jgi:hypothetical protein
MSEFRLNDTQEALIASLAATSGRSETEILDEALLVFAREREEHDQWINAQITPLAAVWDNDDDAVYDRL